MTLALLFPGQGSQRVGMLHDLPEGEAVSRTLDEAHAHGISDDLDSEASLASTINAQLALLIAGVACARTLAEDHGLIPAFVAGHSVGAFAAAVTAGVVAFPDALSSVALRGQLMEAACADGDWGMAAVKGLPTRSASEIADQVGTPDDPLWVANVNSATQTVLSGTAAALRRGADAARDAGASDYERLDIAVASHCPKQDDTARTMAEQLAGLRTGAPTARFLTNMRGRATLSAGAIIDDLAQAVAHPVQWYDATRLMGELGATCAVEVMPGHVLTRLLSPGLPDVVAIALQDTAIASVVARVQRPQSRQQY